MKKREDHAEFTEDDGATWTSLPFDTLVSMNFFGFQPMIMDELEKGFPAFLDKAIKENPLRVNILFLVSQAICFIVEKHP